MSLIIWWGISHRWTNRNPFPDFRPPKFYWKLSSAWSLRLSVIIFSYIVMFSRVTLGRNAQATLRCQCHAKISNRRGLAAAASGSFSYQTGEVDGVRLGSRDLPGPTTHLAIIAKAGTRYQPLPGFSDGLEKFAFKVRPTKDPLCSRECYNRHPLSVRR